MDTVLMPFYETDNILDEDRSNHSMWIIENEFIRGSNSVILKNKLEPGIYTVDATRDFGIFCKKIDYSNDELISFNTSIIPNILEEANKFWLKKEEYSKNKLLHKRGILLYGYPGTGKTSIIKIISQEMIKLGGIVFIVKNPTNLNYYRSFVKDSFRRIQPDTPIATIIEDINMYLESGEDLLDILDGTFNVEHNLIILTSNNTEELEDAYFRPSRIDLYIELTPPSNEIKIEYLKFKNVPDEDINKIIKLSKGFTLADLKELFINTYILGNSIQDSINKLKSKITKKNYMNVEENKQSIGF